MLNNHYQSNHSAIKHVIKKTFLTNKYKTFTKIPKPE